MTIKKRRSRYQLGGRHLNIPGSNLQVGGRGKKMLPRKLQTGGTGGSMYADNTVQAAGQGGAGTTSNIVFQESNPALQEQREQSLVDQNKTAVEEGAALEQEIKAEDMQSKLDIQAAEDKVNAMSNTASSGIKSGIELGKKSGLIDKSAGSMGFGAALNAYKAQRSVNLATKAYKGVTSGVSTAKQAAQAAKSVKLAKDSGTLLMYGQEGAKVGSAASAGLSALNNANVYAAAANYAGKGIKKLSDDDDATTWTSGEATGDVLSKAGEYAGYGATIGALGGPLAPITSTAGAIVGGVVGAGVGIYQGLTGRNKARKAESIYKAKKKKKVDKYNKELMTNFSSQKARIAAGNMAQKTYSGYDLGTNVVAQRGGYRTMPKYI